MLLDYGLLTICAIAMFALVIPALEAFIDPSRQPMQLDREQIRRSGE